VPEVRARGGKYTSPNTHGQWWIQGRGGKGNRPCRLSESLKCQRSGLGEHTPHPTPMVSGGSRGGAVGAIAPVGWSDKIDIFANFHQNILLIRLFPAFTDSFSIGQTNMYVHFHKLSPVWWQNWQLHDPCTGGCLYPLSQYFLVLASKALKKERKTLTICHHLSNVVRNCFCD